MSQIVSQNSRDNSSNRRVTQDDILSTLTVSNNCLLPCLDDRINSLISTQVNNGVTNPYLVKDTVVTRDELIATTPRLSGGQPVVSLPTAPPLVSGQSGGGGTYAYPTQGISPPNSNVQPQPGVDVITLIPAPGPGLMIIPRIIEIKIPKDGSITNPAYTPQIRNDLIPAPGVPTPNPNYFLVFQLRDRYPVLVELKQNPASLTWRVVPFGGNVNTDGVIGPSFISNSQAGAGGGGTPFGTPANSALMSSEQKVFVISNGNEEGLFFDDDYESKNFNRTNRYQVNLPGLVNGFVTTQATKEVTTDFSVLPPGPEGGYAGYNYSPVNQPLTMFMDQPLLPNRGRDFTVRVHYNIVPVLD